MIRISSRRGQRFAWVLAVALVLVALPVVAQIAPMGGHYGGRSSDTGHDPGSVTGMGAYAASVPLDLPASRGGIPIQIVAGGNSVGAAGLGWDIPLSFIRRDTTYARRRPVVGSDSVPAPREQVTLTLQGRTMDLVPRGTGTGDWVPRYDAPTFLLHEGTSSWALYDGDGQTFTFTTPTPLAGTGLWLLTSISGPGGNTVQLDYDVLPQTLPGGGGVSIDLIRISYNRHPATPCFKNEVALTYGQPSTTGPLAMTVLGDKVLARMRTLLAVDVLARASCGGSPEQLRRYELGYQPDADTQLPRLRTVNLLGRQGTPEQFVPLPVARYGYGSATIGGKLQYAKTQTVALPTGADTTQISSTRLDVVASPPVPACLPYATWQSLTDVTGDGRPDLVFKKNNTLWVGLNRPAAGGATTFAQTGTTVQLTDTTLTAGAFEERSATRNRFTYSANNVNVDQVWRQAIDVNGDGRVDLIDAAETSGQWVVYLNTPDTSVPSGVKWLRRSIYISNIYNHLSARGHNVNANYIPLASRYTGRDRVVGACWRWDGTQWVWYSAGFTNGSCGNFPDVVLSTSPEKTYVEWELSDVNGDGFPDLLLNSSRVDEARSGPPTWTGTNQEVVNGQMTIWTRPLANTGNNLDAMINLRGLLIETGGTPFSTPITLKAGTECGVAVWASTGDTQDAVCEVVDVNGDGLLDRVENFTTVSLGTGKGFLGVTMTLPGPLATQRSAQVRTCVDPNPDPPGTTTFFATQYAGLRDLTGDGIPDYVDGTGTSWRVAVGTGTGFAKPVNIEVVGSAFSLSSETEQCNGDVSNTVRGLFDIDGDGRPDVVELNAGALDVYQLSGGAAPRNPEAGRLNLVDNGHGARTTIGYRSAKEDGTTAHQVPFPEVVVTSVKTAGTLGLGASVNATLYAYGGAQLYFDSSRQAWLMAGYERTVQQLLVSNVRLLWDSRVTITDTWPLPAFAATPKNERFGRYLKVGKPRDSTTLVAIVPNDPWALLTVNVASDTRRVGQTHYEWATRLLEEPAIPGTLTLDCMEMMFPYSFIDSWANNPGFYDICSAHGFVFGLSTESWRGSSGPPSTANVSTRSEARSVDDYGRLTSIYHRKDRSRNDDDVCEDVAYAVPTTGTGPRILSAPASRILWDCRKSGLPTYHSEQWTYDGLAQGSVSNGFLTSHLVDRRDGTTGAVLSSVRGYDALYDSAGNPYQITRQRDDGAFRTLTFEYDPWGLALTRERVDATRAATLEVRASLDPISLAPLRTTDANLTEWGTDYDGYGRRVRSTVTPPGQGPGVLSTVAYLGDAENDPAGRRVMTKGFSSLPTPGTEGTTPGLTGTLYLDELGRQRRVESDLGADYANEVMVTGARTYDGVGRVLFEADPYPRSESASTVYGTTYYFQSDGAPNCFIRGKGLQPITTSGDEASEIFPTCFTRSFASNTETISVTDAAASITGSPQAGVSRSAVLTAVGRVLSRSTWQGNTRLEHATFSHDPMGHLTGMTRYLDPATLAQPVSWSWTYDSFGQLLQWQEPEAVPVSVTFNNWGEVQAVRWTDTTTAPSSNRELLSSYDGLGRITHAESRKNGVIEPDSVYEYMYDSGASPTALVTPTYVLGRLAQLKASNSEVYFSYDGLGRPDTQTFSDGKDVYVERSYLNAEGAPDALELYLPDNGFRPEAVRYGYDSAHRLGSIGYEDGSLSQDIFSAEGIDPFGRLVKASYANKALGYSVNYAPSGRRLFQNELYSSSSGSRQFINLGYDAAGRERARREVVNGAATGPKTNLGYDALGRLTSSLETDGTVTLASWQYTYDPLATSPTSTTWWLQATPR